MTRLAALAGRLAFLLGAAAVLCPATAGGQTVRLEALKPAAAPWPPAVDTRDGTRVCSEALVGSRTTYDVGPGRKYPELTDVPWLSLGAGDVVNIHYRSAPYRTKIGLRAQGTEAAPVVINGVTSPDCKRPEISGQDALTAADAARSSFMSKQYSEFLGTIFIYRASGDPWTYRPRHITIRNLRITGAHKNNTYIAQDGSTGRYALGAAGIYAVRVEHLVVENNEITGNGNGVFVNSRDNDDYSAYVTIRRNLLQGNGNIGSYTEHNLYVQAVRPLYEGNDIGQLVPGALGSSLKDRSSGTVIRYNRIAAAARALDLVEIEGGVAPVLDDPLYPYAWVYGNLITSDWNRPATSSSLLIHWGGDNTPKYFRNGTLYFYNNTVVTKATSAQVYYLCVFDMPTQKQTVNLQRNVFVHTGSSRLNLAYQGGNLVMRGANWLSSGWAKGWGGAVTLERGGAKVIEGREPGWQADFVPAPGSALLDTGDGAVADLPGLPAAAAREALDVTAQWVPPAGLAPRTRGAAGSALGAFDRRAVATGTKP